MTRMVLVTNWKRSSLLFTTLLLIVAVGGARAASTFTVSPTSLSFSANTGASTVDSLMITNYTSYPLVLTTTLSGSGSGNFSVPSVGAITVPASGSAMLGVTFNAPNVTGTSSGSLTLRSF